MTPPQRPGDPGDVDPIAVIAAESAVRRTHGAYSQACDDGRFDDLPLCSRMMSNWWSVEPWPHGGGLPPVRGLPPHSRLRAAGGIS